MELPASSQAKNASVAVSTCLTVTVLCNLQCDLSHVVKRNKFVARQ